MDISGTTVGRYEIRELLGTGAMAEVYKTYDPEIDRTGAIKVLKEGLIKDAEYLNRFLKEASAAGKLVHPNIVTVYDVGKVHELPYIVMELLDGETLNDILQRGARLPYETVITIAMQVASALDYAHAQGVVHRDIKPDNIIWHADKNTVKIADFGIAKRADTDIQESTQAGLIMGTPRYMSPEQARGQTIDGRSDLFSLGVILYELITGHKAFDGESMATLIMQILEKEPPSLRQYSPDVPAGLQSIITRLLKKAPEKRFKNGGELHDALARELRHVQEQREHQDFLPMQVRWTAAMGAIVGIVMLVSSVLVFNVQSKLLTEQAVSAGVSLATFIAAESAVPLLGEDWIGLDTLNEEALKRKSFEYLRVIDHTGVVRSATNKSLSGKPWETPEKTFLLATRQDVKVYEIKQKDAHTVYNFVAPIHFNDTNIGSISLGIGQDQLANVMSVTKRIMLVLAFSVMLAVLLAVYFFNRIVAKNLQVVWHAIADFGKGNHNTRISRSWKNEFGNLASAFNVMAEQIQIDLQNNDGEEAATAEAVNKLIIDDTAALDTTSGDQTIIQPFAEDK